MRWMFPLLTLLTASVALTAWRYSLLPSIGEQLASAVRPSAPAKKPFFERVVLPLARRLAPSYRFAIPFSDRRKLRQRLASAGDPYGLTVNDIVQLKVSCLILTVPIGVYYGMSWELSWLSIAIIVMAAAVPMFFVPDIVLSEVAEKRQDEITQTLPDLMDLLGLSVTAGVGFDLALNHVVGRMRGPLAQELDRMLQQLRLGTPRRNAYRKVIWRNESPALRAFFSALVQADELGTPIAEILEWQSETLRHQRIQLARRKGAKASNMVSLVLATVLLLSLMFIMLATLILNFMNSGGIQALFGQ